VEIPLLLLRLIFLLKRIIVAIFKSVLYRPLRFFLRTIYYIFIFPVYKTYLLLNKKLRVNKSGNKKAISSLLINKRVIHALIILLTILLSYANLTSAKDAVSSEDVVRKTILSKLVTDELTQPNELIEEYQTDSADFTPTKESYLADNVIRPDTRINTYEKLDNLDAIDFESIRVGEVEDYMATNESVPERSGKISYTVKSGDTASTIAQKFGISVNTILWANNLTAHSYIRPGDELIIPPMTGVLHIVARGENLSYISKYYGIDSSKILEASHVSDPNQISVGQELMIPGGAEQGNTVASKSVPGSRSSSNVITAPKESSKPVYGTKMNWPTEGHTITQYYSARHNGLDIANKLGTPIYAADAGKVETASWNNGGYGNQIVINHGGGKTTRYGHLSAFAVKVGDVVTKGQYIGAMGSTGRSTGSHVHFEVMFNGVRYNPLNYLDY
jgi:murein DD-endopeptidase MepM/ murein hydrolase activator NlpD